MPRSSFSPDLALFLSLLEKRAPRPLSIQDMARLLDVEEYDRRQLKLGLETKVKERILRRVGKTRYQWIRELERSPTQSTRLSLQARSGRDSPRGGAIRVEGHYARVRGGYGFVEVLGRAAERYHRDILIPAGAEGPALHGDKVVVEVLRRDPRLRRAVGRVVAVSGAVHEDIIGTLERNRFGWRLLPENELLPAFDLVGERLPDRDQVGRIARGRLLPPSAPLRPPCVALDEVLGSADDPDVQFLILTSEHGLRVDFPMPAREEAARLPCDPSAVDLAGRLDLTGHEFVTIDGETARDFDDAVCVEPGEEEGYRLWVAIADVAHYVRPGSALDREAARRGTSVYFPDRAIPMLPPELSSELCSLRPDRPRLVLAAEMDLDRKGLCSGARFHRGVIRSRARLTYTQVAAALSEADPDSPRVRQELAPLLPSLSRMRTLMTLLYRNRVRAGSLDLDLPEALVDLSEEGRSLGIRLQVRNDAHRLIEEFMLAANRAVASHLREQGIPLPYRIHEPPDAVDIDELNRFLGPFGFHVDYEDKIRPQDIQRLVNDLEGHRLARVLTRLTLRSLKQAQYSTRNLGHFGLAFPIYCHFTSPIRRYPDLLVHRQLRRAMDGDVATARDAVLELEQASVDSSQAEREAMSAERAMLDLKKAELMSQHVGESYTGTIVTVMNLGFFVELDTYPIEGLVRADSLEGDRFVFLEEEGALKGLRTRQRFRLGDRVVVEVAEVSLRRREIDLRLQRRLEEDASKPSKRKPRKERIPRRKRSRA